MLHTKTAGLADAASAQLFSTEERALAQASRELSHWRTRLRFDDFSQSSVYARGALTCACRAEKAARPG